MKWITFFGLKLCTQTSTCRTICTFYYLSLFEPLLLQKMSFKNTQVQSNSQLFLRSSFNDVTSTMIMADRTVAIYKSRSILMQCRTFICKSRKNAVSIIIASPGDRIRDHLLKPQIQWLLCQSVWNRPLRSVRHSLVKNVRFCMRLGQAISGSHSSEYGGGACNRLLNWSPVT